MGIPLLTYPRRAALGICVGGAAAILAMGCSVAAGQYTPPKAGTVIELFTSQGCSFCPRADRWLASIAGRRELIALSYAVDYWDYMGWRDTLASPAFTARQKAYAAAHGSARVYTPQIVVNGLAEAAGGDEAEISQAIEIANGQDGAMSLPIRLYDAGNHLAVDVAAGSGGPAGVFLLRVTRTATVDVLRGENAGRALTYTNVVRRIEKLGDWSGESATFALPGSPGLGEGFVVLVQKGTPERPGAILAAAKTDGL